MNRNVKPKTVDTVERERERESRNLKNEGFISSVKKLYIKYRNIKINLVTRS